MWLLLAMPLALVRLALALVAPLARMWPLARMPPLPLAPPPLLPLQPLLVPYVSLWYLR